MAKELPYFKFEPNQWENGNIQMVSREDKGLFVDLCSMYWSRLGDVPFKLAVQKLCGGNATAFDSLIEEGIFEVIDGLICIDYLNEQLGNFEDTSKQNSQNAKARWAKVHAERVLCDRNATASSSQCESDAIREEKRREEKSKDKKGSVNLFSEDTTIKPKSNFDKNFDKYKLFMVKYNEIKNSPYKGSKNDVNNFMFWLETYTPSEILQAVSNHDEKFWAEKINPQWLFRTKDTKGQPVDYIGQLLEHVNRSKLRV